MAIALHDNSISWQFQDKLDAYCKKTYQSFVKDDSKTVESVNKHRKEPFPAELQFAFVRMSCVHYGKKRELIFSRCTKDTFCIMTLFCVTISGVIGIVGRILLSSF